MALVERPQSNSLFQSYIQATSSRTSKPSSGNQIGSRLWRNLSAMNWDSRILPRSSVWRFRRTLIPWHRYVLTSLSMMALTHDASWQDETLNIFDTMLALTLPKGTHVTDYISAPAPSLSRTSLHGGYLSIPATSVNVEHMFSHGR